MSDTITVTGVFDTLAATTEQTYRVPIVLDNGYVYEFQEMWILSSTSYAAQDTNYNTFTLYDPSGNVIAVVANGPASTGLAIGYGGAGTTTTATSAYKYIDASDTAKVPYISAVPTGDGRAMSHVTVLTKWKRLRNV